MTEEFSGLRNARVPAAAGPTADAEGLRRAYLDLLKLALCDLAGATTVSVGKAEDGSVASREIAGADLRLRAAGMDWPRQGMTMVGLNRLDDLQARVEAVVRDAVEGDLIEAGVWRGGASMLMRATLDSLGDSGRTVWLADSFQGFPKPDRQKALNAADYLAVPVEEVQENFSRLGLDHGVSFVPGFFEETMPGLAGRRWSLVRLDGDTYEATMVTLQSLYPGLAAGGHLVVDDYGALEECRRAVDDFRERHGISEPLEEVDWTCVAWRRETEQRIEPAGQPAPHPEVVAPQRVEPMSRAPATGVPSERELELAGELAALRERLARRPLARLGATLRTRRR